MINTLINAFGFEEYGGGCALKRADLELYSPAKKRGVATYQKKLLECRGAHNA